MKSYQSGDVVFRTAKIFNKSTGAVLSLLPQMQGCDIWEDMAKPTLYATVYLYDAINLLTRFPIIGEEFIELSFETPGISLPVTYKFRVFEVANIQQSDNRQAHGYTLRCVSEEHFNNGAQQVLTAWEGILSDYTKHILGKYLNSKKSIVLEPTKGIHKIIGPRWSPLEAIDFARKNAVSNKYPSSSFVFFENQAGFYFKTVEAIIEEGRPTIGTRVFTFLHAPAATTPATGYRSVIEHENISRTDSIETINSGVLQGQSQSFDLLTKKFETKDFNIKSSFNSYKSLDKSNQMIHSKDFISEFGTKGPNIYYHMKDSSRSAAYIDDMLPSRAAFTTLLNANITRCLVHGDSGLKAGDVITLNLPEVVGTTGTKPLDPLMSGNYIILRLRHILTNGPKPQHRISFDAAKIGLNT